MPGGRIRMNDGPENEGEKWMEKALELARQGKGKVAPNPLVGCVIVRNNTVVGTGFHEEFGADHAEVNALREAGDAARGSDLYVNLEPCCHSGKTPPCTDRIREAGVEHVFIANPDPNPRMRGSGIQELRNAGINVSIGVKSKQAAFLNRRFITFHEKNRPYITAKWAMSFDGKIATKSGDSRWITGRNSRRHARRRRVDEGAVMVGSGTLLQDNPTLLGPEDYTGPQPVRIIVDSRVRLSEGYNLVQTSDRSRVILATTESAEPERIQFVRDHGIEVIQVPKKGGRVDVAELLTELAERNIQAVLVEGGGTLISSFFERDLVDEMNLFVAPKIIGGSSAVTPFEGEGFQTMTDVPELEVLESRWYDSDLFIRALYRDPIVPEREEAT